MSVCQHFTMMVRNVARVLLDARSAPAVIYRPVVIVSLGVTSNLGTKYAFHTAPQASQQTTILRHAKEASVPYFAPGATTTQHTET